MKSKFIIKFSVLLLSLGMNMASYSQEFPSREYGVPGKLVNSPYFKHFAVLMQDSTLFGNRFIYYDSENNEIVDLPFLYIDSATFYECERKLLNPDSLVKLMYQDDGFFPSINEKLFRIFLKRYVRLYAGYLDENNKKVICIQFVTMKEFNESVIFRYELYAYSFVPKYRLIYIYFD